MLLTAETFFQIVHSLRTDGISRAGKETRKLPRVGARGKVDIILPKAKGGLRITVTVRDISAAGIGILIGEPYLSKGDEFLLVLESSADEERKALVCVVRRSAKLQEKLYSVGASFRKESLTQSASNRTPSIAAPLPEGADEARCNELEQRLRNALLAR